MEDRLTNKNKNIQSLQIESQIHYETWIDILLLEFSCSLIKWNTQRAKIAILPSKLIKSCKLAT